ncbi:amino acid--tRNA ligase-related protein [Streptomyces sp. NPDC006487]|uniref:amino acid--tRNA ligase-related protein n=1 Tax=Streptomyces sp. NPDC006487 TaxID=3364748 RepID=UPI0036C9C9DF
MNSSARPAPAVPQHGQERRSGQIRDRLAKRAALLSEGVDLYAAAQPVADRVHLLQGRYGGLPPRIRTGARVSVAGRIMSRRDHRDVEFATLRDMSEEIQILLPGDRAAAEPRVRWRASVDLGDLVVVEGELITTGSGALAVEAVDFRLASKALRPLPGRPVGGARAGRSEGSAGAGRSEAAPGAGRPATARHRYQRMMLDPAETARTRRRGAVLRVLREELYARGFTEADTPLLHPVHGGTARPFTARMNAWGIPLHLRGTAEMYLKRLMVGGMDRVFEIGRSFRNEGVDATHFPEFSACEAYLVHSDYLATADLAEQLVAAAAVALNGPGSTAPVFARHRLHDLLGRVLGTPVDSATSQAELAGHAERHGLPVPPGSGAGALAVLLYRKLVEPGLREPTFVLDFPLEGAILARPHRRDPALVEAWTLVIGGLDVGQGCSELTDPVEQRRRFTEQALAREGRQLGVTELDEEFLAALEHGLPPLGGLMFGVDRLITALGGGGRLRDHQCHPIVRPAPAPDTPTAPATPIAPAATTAPTPTTAPSPSHPTTDRKEATEWTPATSDSTPC